MLLSTPLKLALTLIGVPRGALALTVPVPLPFVRVRFVVSEFIQVTEVVMSCGVELPGNIAFAVNVTVEAGAGVVGEEKWPEQHAGAVRLLTGLLTTASSAPPRPAIPADTANSETFDQPAPIPDVRAATSELRTASTARPDDDRRKL